MEKKADFKMNLKCTKERVHIVKEKNVMELFTEKLFQTDLLSFVIYAKNNQLFDWPTEIHKLYTQQIWLTLNRQSKELEEYRDRQSLIEQEKADIKMLLRKWIF